MFDVYKVKKQTWSSLYEKLPPTVENGFEKKNTFGNTSGVLRNGPPVLSNRFATCRVP